MKILVIDGNPRKSGNTLQLTKAFVNGMQNATDCQTEYFDVYKSQIKPCVGCFGCWRNGGKCVQHDDVEGFLQAYVSADTIVWSFPLYYFGLPGQVKNLLDRTLPTLQPKMEDDGENGTGTHPSRYDTNKQKKVIISTCGFHTTRGNYDLVEGLFDRIYGGKYEKVFCAQGAVFSSQRLKEMGQQYLQEVQKAGEQFVNGGIKPEVREKLDKAFLSKQQYESYVNGVWEE